MTKLDKHLKRLLEQDAQRITVSEKQLANMARRVVSARAKQDVPDVSVSYFRRLRRFLSGDTLVSWRVVAVVGLFLGATFMIGLPGGSQPGDEYTFPPVATDKMVQPDVLTGSPSRLAQNAGDEPLLIMERVQLPLVSSPERGL